MKEQRLKRSGENGKYVEGGVWVTQQRSQTAMFVARTLQSTYKYL